MQRIFVTPSQMMWASCMCESHLMKLNTDGVFKSATGHQCNITKLQIGWCFNFSVFFSMPILSKKKKQKRMLLICYWIIILHNHIMCSICSEKEEAITLWDWRYYLAFQNESERRIQIYIYMCVKEEREMPNSVQNEAFFYVGYALFW